MDLTVDRPADIRRPAFAGARRPVASSALAAVDVRPLRPSSLMPLLVTPAAADIDILAWSQAHRQIVDEWLLDYRAVLFRGFQVSTSARLQEFAAATSTGPLMTCPDESTPRAALGDRIYESTVYPAHQAINLHNEASYCDQWPRKIYFCCLEPSREGGATPLADVRRVVAHLAPDVLDEFARRGVAYIRNFNTRRIGLTWQEAFWTEDPSAVEEYCRRHEIRYEWKPSGELRTTAVRPAFRRHPVSGELLWFNHAVFFHLAAYPDEMRAALIDALGRDNLPYETSFGDGTTIDPGIVHDVLRAFQAEQVTFAWERGDVLLLDNMTVAHGREPYEGPRSIIVAMTEAQGR